MEQLIQDWGYIILFLYSFGGGFLALAVASVLAYAGDLNIYITLLVAATSNFLGDQFLFYMARTNKHFAKEILRKHRRKVAWAHLIMKKRGDAAVFLQKYIYGVKTMIPLAMGLTKYSFSKFTVLNFFATIVWAVVIGYLSYSLGQVVIDAADEYKNYGIVIAVVFVVLLAYIFKKIEKK
jgi:membrane protein DedA with SNARE-associated domain